MNVNSIYNMIYKKGKKGHIEDICFILKNHEVIKY